MDSQLEANPASVAAFLNTLANEPAVQAVAAQTGKTPSQVAQAIYDAAKGQIGWAALLRVKTGESGSPPAPPPGSGKGSA
jgi:hypothetical protein